MTFKVKEETDTKRTELSHPGNVNSLNFHPRKVCERKYLLDWNLNTLIGLKAYFLRRRWFRGPTIPF